MTRYMTFRDFSMCKAVLLAGLIGVGLVASSLGRLDPGEDDGFEEARQGGQIEFIDWDCDHEPVLYAPWI